MRSIPEFSSLGKKRQISLSHSLTVWSRDTTMGLSRPRYTANPQTLILASNPSHAKTLKRPSRHSKANYAAAIAFPLPLNLLANLSSLSLTSMRTMGMTGKNSRKSPMNTNLPPGRPATKVTKTNKKQQRSNPLKTRQRKPLVTSLMSSPFLTATLKRIMRTSCLPAFHIFRESRTSLNAP